MQRRYSVLSVSIMFFVISHAAWIWEGFITMYEVGRFVNRGFLHGCWLPVYGTGSLLLIYVFGQTDCSFWKVFLGSAVICTSIEYCTAVALEIVFKQKWWDYGFISNNFNGRICLPVIPVFGIAGYMLVYLVAPYLDRQIQKISLPVQKSICFVFLFLFVMDFIFSLFKPNAGYGITF